MKNYNRLMIAVLLILAFGFFGMNRAFYSEKEETERMHVVQIERLSQSIRQSRNYSLKDYPLIRKVVSTKHPSNEFLQSDDYDSAVRKINGRFYRFDYVSSSDELNFRYVEAIYAAVFMVIAGVLLFVRFRVIKLAEILSNVSEEIARGNLTMPIKEQKWSFFGRTAWGIDVLRAELEQQKKDNLEFEKEHKTMILSISHDIKTPLASIKLYAQALTHGLYRDQRKVEEVYRKIDDNASEIEGKLAEIISASRDNFLKLDVKEGEFYCSGLIGEIRRYYEDKMEIEQTEFEIGSYADCLLHGDLDRAVEVLQNVLENAIKYGNGRYVKISFEEEEDCMLITVANSGCSLSEEEIANVFESFWRGANSENIRGSGLGLYICQQLMQMMDGAVFAQRLEDEMRVTAVFRKV